MNPTLNRLMLSFAAVVGYGLFNAYLRTMAPIAVGNASVQQLENSNDAYLNAMTVMYGYPLQGLSVLVLLIVLGTIWFKPVVNAFKHEEN